jgi:hypothetical protein
LQSQRQHQHRLVWLVTDRLHGLWFLDEVGVNLAMSRADGKLSATVILLANPMINAIND